MRGSVKRVLENFRGLEPAQQERVTQALVEALEISALARARMVQNRPAAIPPDASGKAGKSAHAR